jgi:GNAT superfamily N-acetyltransferase
VKQAFIRPSVPADAKAISRVIVGALRETNAPDYGLEIIERLAGGFSPAHVADMLRDGDLLVAVMAGEIVGTARLQDATIRTVFVAPHAQGRGIGAALMGAIERTARNRGIGRLNLSSSVTAEGFYARLGFSALRDQYNGDERTIIMEKALEPSVVRPAGNSG